jgi:hypothetical protein
MTRNTRSPASIRDSPASGSGAMGGRRRLDFPDFRAAHQSERLRIGRELLT